MNQFDIIKIYTIFMQQQQWDTNSIQVPVDYKLADIGTYPGTQNKVILSVFYHNVKNIF